MQTYIMPDVALNTPPKTLDLPKNLGDGLVIRQATSADVDALAAFNQQLHAAPHDPPEGLSLWTRDLMSGDHPTTTASDFILVEDTRAGHKIVSATCLIPQVWAYDGIPFPVGRPELVGTDSAYRRRGLSRAVMEQIHALSEAYDHLVQGITGIPWFYRQFGYEYALPLGGGHALYVTDIPKLKEGETESYTIRPAVAADIPTLTRLYNRYYADKLVYSVVDEARWRYDLDGRSEGSIEVLKTYCVLNAEKKIIAYYLTSGSLWGESLALFELMVDKGVSLRALLPTVLRALKKQGEAMLTSNSKEQKRLVKIFFHLSPDHPLFTALEAKLGPVRPPYGWYIRVPHLPAFIRHLAPALEKRLYQSVMSGFSGALNLSFYRGGLQLTFEEGQLAGVSGWQAPDSDQRWEGASFPPLVFLQLLFGHRSLAELRYAFPDCTADEEATLLLNALFPKRPSWVDPLA